MKIDVICEHCNEIFQRDKAAYNQNIKRGTKNFCSHKCSIAYHTTGEYILCDYCGKKCWKVQSKIKMSKMSKSGKLFCSNNCSLLYFQNLRNNRSPNYINGISNYRNKAFDIYKVECTICTYSIENILEVHHSDSNRTNNELDNLYILCPTHHKEATLKLIDLSKYDRKLKVI
jgi:5-methylcytosine-specific restriction endonuclease McrA